MIICSVTERDGVCWQQTGAKNSTTVRERERERGQSERPAFKLARVFIPHKVLLFGDSEVGSSISVLISSLIPHHMILFGEGLQQSRTSKHVCRYYGEPLHAWKKKSWRNPFCGSGGS